MKKDYLFDEMNDFYLSYAKLSGKKIKDIVGYISNGFGDPVFKISKIILEDGTAHGAVRWVEGEHDCPYVDDMDSDTSELIVALDEEEEKED